MINIINLNMFRAFPNKQVNRKLCLPALASLTAVVKPPGASTNILCLNRKRFSATYCATQLGCFESKDVKLIVTKLLNNLK